MEGGLLPSTSTINPRIDLESFVTYVVSQSLSLSICEILDYSQSLASIGSRGRKETEGIIVPHLSRNEKTFTQHCPSIPVSTVLRLPPLTFLIPLSPLPLQALCSWSIESRKNRRLSGNLSCLLSRLSSLRLPPYDTSRLSRSRGDERLRRGSETDDVSSLGRRGGRT